MSPQRRRTCFPEKKINIFVGEAKNETSFGASAEIFLTDSRNLCRGNDDVTHKRVYVDVALVSYRFPLFCMSIPFETDAVTAADIMFHRCARLSSDVKQ